MISKLGYFGSKTITPAPIVLSDCVAARLAVQEVGDRRAAFRFWEETGRRVEVEAVAARGGIGGVEFLPVLVAVVQRLHGEVRPPRDVDVAVAELLGSGVRWLEL